MTLERQYCTFHLGELFLGVEVHQVQEVLRGQTMTRVPLAPRAIRGLINLRGQIVPAVDLRERFGLPLLGTGRQPMNLVVRTDEGAVSLLVDEIGEVLDVEDAEDEAAPETLVGGARELIRCVYKLPDRLLLILDTEKALVLEPSPASR